MFTRQLIEEIKNKLYLLGKKDSLFDLVKDVGNDAYFSIVVDGENKRITVQKFIDIVSEVIGESKIGISLEFGNSMLEGISLKTLTEALNALYVVDADSIVAHSIYKTVILPPNMDENNSCKLTLSMLQTPNTKYIIKYNYDVLENITIPANCILLVDGGKLFSASGVKTITGVRNTFVDNNDYTLFETTFSKEICVDLNSIHLVNFNYASAELAEGTITSDKIAPRPYSLVNVKGYKILNPNDSFVSQITDNNTIYEIQDTFNLDDETITIPVDCVLKFTGGSISNGALVLNNTYIDADNACFDCAVSGTISNNKCNSVWFDFGNNDFTEAYIRLVSLGNSSGKPILFKQGEYNLGNDVNNVVACVSCDFNGSIINLTTDLRDCQLKFSNGTRTEITDATLRECLAKIVNERVKSLKDTTESEEVLSDLKELYGTFIQIGHPQGIAGVAPNPPIADYDDFDPDDHPGLEIVRNYKYNGNYTMRMQYEQFFVDEFGYVNNEPFNDNIGLVNGIFDASTIEAYSIKADNPIAISNLTINITDNYVGEPVTNGNYRNVGIGVTESLNVTLEHVVFHALVTKHNGYRFFQINQGYNYTLNDVYSDNTPWVYDEDQETHKKSSYSSYVFSLGRIIGLNLNDVRVPELITNSWGATGCNYITDVKVTNCSLSRIDCHYRINNLTVLDSELGTYGIAVTGYGKIVMQRCNFYGRYAIRIRADYGCYFDGDIIIKDCTLSNNHTKGCEFVRGLISDFNYNCTSPNRDKGLVANNIYADGVKIESAGVAAFFRTRLNDAEEDVGAFSTSKQTRVLPNVNVKNLEMSTTDTIQRSTYVYCHSAYDVFVVPPSNRMIINIDGFRNNYIDVVTKSVGVLLCTTDCDNTRLDLVKNNGYPISIIANNVSYISTKVRGAVEDDVDPSSMTFKYVKQKADYTIYNSTVSTLQGPPDTDTDSPVTFNFNECLVKAYDNTETKTKRIKLLFNDCLFDVSRSGNYAWYNKSGNRLFTNNPNIFIIDSRLTDTLATALSLNTDYDDRLIPNTTPPSSPVIGDMCFQGNIPTWWNGTNWVNAAGIVVYPITYVLTHLTTSNTSLPEGGSSYTATLSAASGYTLPTTITVVMGSSTLVGGTDYTYNATSGEVVILGTGGSGGVTGALTITADGNVIS